MPSKRERDSFIQVWVDRRYLATVHNLMLAKEPNPPKHLSDIYRYALEVFVQSAVQQGLVEFVETTQEACATLRHFDANLNPGRRCLKNLTLNLQQDAEVLVDRPSADEVGGLIDNAIASMKEEKR